MNRKHENTSAVKDRIWGFFDRLEGDKIVWIIVLSLMVISWLAIFSSTPLLALETGMTRLEIMKEQIMLTFGGLLLIIGIYKLPNILILRAFSQLGYGLSLFLLTILASHADLGFIRAEYINGAWRTLNVLGAQVHVFEIVKVSMVVYLAWAINEYNTDISGPRSRWTFWIMNTLGKHRRLSWMRKPLWKSMFYIYMPIGIVTVLTMLGSNSSGLIVGAVMVATLLIGGLHLKQVLLTALGGIVVLSLMLGVYHISDNEVFGRFGTGISRLKLDTDPTQLHELRGDKFQERLGKIHQPNAAKIAVYEGGLIGKGPGGSTQKYAVPVMFGDYMYSFILEEYGIWLGLFVILLYSSILARGAWIAKLCETNYARTAIGGLSFLITSQAFLHMFINVDMGPLTGQTLPLVSHGTSSFLAFCVAFGVILAISRMANKQILAEEKAYEAAMAAKDDVQASMDVLEQLDNIE